jgi:hypothetical protein
MWAGSDHSVFNSRGLKIPSFTGSSGAPCGDVGRVVLYLSRGYMYEAGYSDDGVAMSSRRLVLATRLSSTPSAGAVSLAGLI